MVPSPPLWAVLGDVLLCLGAGLLLGAVRDGATLASGSGPVRCFVWDVLAFAAAAFVCCGFAAGASATGAARWYMAAAMGLGLLDGQCNLAIRRDGDDLNLNGLASFQHGSKVLHKLIAYLRNVNKAGFAFRQGNEGAKRLNAGNFAFQDVSNL